MSSLGSQIENPAFRASSTWQPLALPCPCHHHPVSLLGLSLGETKWEPWSFPVANIARTDTRVKKPDLENLSAANVVITTAHSSSELAEHLGKPGFCTKHTAVHCLPGFPVPLCPLLRSTEVAAGCAGGTGTRRAVGCLGATLPLYTGYPATHQHCSDRSAQCSRALSLCGSPSASKNMVSGLSAKSFF